MTMNNVIHLFMMIDQDPDFRRQIYQCGDPIELMTYLNSRGYYFDPDEMEDAIDYMHVQCQTLEEAQTLLHKADLLRYLLFANNNQCESIQMKG